MHQMSMCIYELNVKYGLYRTFKINKVESRITVRNRAREMTQQYGMMM